jgi:hypothetical protein
LSFESIFEEPRAEVEVMEEEEDKEEEEEVGATLMVR